MIISALFPGIMFFMVFSLLIVHRLAGAQANMLNRDPAYSLVSLPACQLDCLFACSQPKIN
jgi:hypothetical protein